MITGPAKQIFVNLPVRDLKKSMAFYQALGFSINPQFTDDKGACIVIGNHIFAMLLSEPFFKTFTKKSVADASRAAEVMTAISLDSRQRVDDLADKALQSGGSGNMPPQDHGWMYLRSFQDPDGHICEVVYADESKIPAEPGAKATAKS